VICISTGVRRVNIMDQHTRATSVGTVEHEMKNNNNDDGNKRKTVREGVVLVLWHGYSAGAHNNNAVIRRGCIWAGEGKGNFVSFVANNNNTVFRKPRSC